jgi:proline iminopeptidase
MNSITRYYNITSVKKYSLLILLLTTIILFTGCTGKPQYKEGYIKVTGGKVFYTIQGADKPGIPILLLHGGPGSGGKKMESGFASIAGDRPVIVYDQLGCGRSDRPADTTLWVTSRFVEELDQVINALGYPKIHLLGHSWGGTLAAQYLIDKQPKKVVSAILSSPMLDTKMWEDDAKAYIKLLPENVQQDLKLEFSKDTAGQQAYQAAVATYYKQHVYRGPALPVPPKDTSSLPAFSKQIYEFMWGTNEFSPSGNLMGYSCVAQLHKVKVPVLYICGEYDEATPKSTAYFQQKTPNSAIKVIRNASHSTFREQPQQYFSTLNTFLHQHDK